MIFFHKPYYNLNYMNPNKKILVIYALNPKNYIKYTNYIMQNNLFFKHRKNNLNKSLNILNYKDLLAKKTIIILKNNQINFVKTKRKYVSYFCVIFPNSFFPLSLKYIYNEIILLHICLNLKIPPPKFSLV
jgi:hypothetical protein